MCAVMMSEPRVCIGCGAMSDHDGKIEDFRFVTSIEALEVGLWARDLQICEFCFSDAITAASPSIHTLPDFLNLLENVAARRAYVLARRARTCH
jgi:hypothetical protein